MKAKAHYYSGETKQVKCSLTGAEFTQEPGLIFGTGKTPDLETAISPEAAKAGGYTIADFKPPDKVQSKVDLGLFIREDLGIRRGDPHYMEYYSRWSDYLPLTK